MKRLLCIFGFLAAVAGLAPMHAHAAAAVQLACKNNADSGSNGGTITCTSTVTPASGDKLVAVLSAFDNTGSSGTMTSGNTTCSDNQTSPANTWTFKDSHTGAGSFRDNVAIVESTLSHAAASMVISCSWTSGKYYDLRVYLVTGTSGADGTVVWSTTTTSPINTGSYTPAQTGDALISMFYALDVCNSVTQTGSGWTDDGVQDQADSVSGPADSGHKVYASTSATTNSWTCSAVGGQTMITGIWGYTPSGGGGGSFTAGPSLTVTTAPAVNIGLARPPAVTVTTSPAVAASAGRQASDSDSFTTSPAVATQIGRAAAESDSVTTSPAVAVQQTLARSVAESVTTAPSVNIGLARNLSSSFASSPTVTATAGRSAAIADSFTSAPSVSTQAAHQVAEAESVSSSAAVVSNAGRFVSPAVTVTTSPAISNLQGKGVLPADSVTTSDAVTTNSGRAAALSSSVTTSPAATTQLAASRGIADAATTAPGVSDNAGRAGGQADAATLAVNVSTRLDANRGQADSFTSSPAVATTVGRVAGPAVAVTVADAVSVHVTPGDGQTPLRRRIIVVGM